MKRIFENRKVIVIVLLLVALVGGFIYEQYSAKERSTENAYLNASVIEVAPQVAGRVISVHVHENQRVHKGDPLFDIDPAPIEITLARAEADLAQAMETARQDSAEVAVARAQISQNAADLDNARTTLKRTQKLVAQHFLSQQAIDDAKSHVLMLQAVLEQSRAKLAKALSVPANIEDRADVQKARAAIAQAQLDLDRTHVSASQDGQITNLGINPGSLVSIGQPLFALIAADSFYIDANFKETELPGIRPGQGVDIEIDMYPHHPFHGTVASLSGGTGTAFSLLPPQNATGNWVKIAQRVPVRIRLDKQETDFPLRIGATATVTVHLDPK